jgi:cell division protein FtsB
MSKFKIFISYRRKGGYDTAKLIYERLKMDGYSVSFDLDTLENGNFGNELEKRIKKCKDFIIILNTGIFDCFSEPDYNPKDDWVRIEIGCALAAKKNIVPLRMEDFVYPKRLPSDIKDITKINSIDISPEHFEAGYEKMKNTFLLSKPHWKIRHKKRLLSFISVVFFLVATYLFFTISTAYKQKEREAAEAKMAAQRADSIRIVNEMELMRTADSINAAMEAELARATDSINAAMEAELARATDSIKMYMEAKAAKAQNAQKNATQSPPKKTTQQSSPKSTVQSTPKKTTPQSTPKKTTPQKSSKK